MLGWQTHLDDGRVGQSEGASRDPHRQERGGRAELLGRPGVATMQEPMGDREVGESMEGSGRGNRRDADRWAVGDHRAEPIHRLVVTESVEGGDESVDAVHGERDGGARDTAAPFPQRVVEASDQALDPFGVVGADHRADVGADAIKHPVVSVDHEMGGPIDRGDDGAERGRPPGARIAADDESSGVGVPAQRLGRLGLGPIDDAEVTTITARPGFETVGEVGLPGAPDSGRGRAPARCLEVIGAHQRALEGSVLTADEALQELVSAAWVSVRSFDPTRSPSCLSAALINDAVYRAFKADRRRRDRRPEISVDPQEWRGLTAVDDDILRRVREIMVEASTRGIDPVNMEALRRVIMTGSTEQVARAMGISPRAVRYRCARVAAELAEFTRVA